MKILRILLPLLVVALPVRSHELWIEPQSYQVERGGEIVAALKNGQNFEGIELGWFDKRIAVFDVIDGGTRRAVQGRTGDVPAIQGLHVDQGLAVLAYQSTPATLTYESWEKFQDFFRHKDLGDIRAQHRARGLPETPLKEIYTRYSKALVGVGAAKGSDRDFGFEIELIALANPYRDPLTGGFPVRLMYQGAPRADAQIELFDRAPDGSVTVTLHRTDTTGEARLPVLPGHEYLVDSVVLRVPSDDLAQRYKVQWQSLWAALTFAVPG